MDDNSYDAWQFERKPKPVSARVEAGEIVSNNISFDDYRSMHQIAGASPGYQRIKPPEWVFNNKFRDVILLYAENRLQLYEDGCTRTYEQRLERIRTKTIERRKQNVKTVDSLCRRFVEMKRKGAGGAELKRLSQEIESLDSSIRLMDAGIVQTAVAVVYRYYRLRENSVDIAVALSIKPPAVRQLLARVRNLAKRGARKVGLPAAEGKRREVRHICPICGKEFITVYSFRKYCGATCKRRRDAQERKGRHALLCPECRKRMQPKPAPPFQFRCQFTTQ